MRIGIFRTAKRSRYAPDMFRKKLSDCHCVHHITYFKEVEPILQSYPKGTIFVIFRPEHIAENFQDFFRMCSKYHIEHPYTEAEVIDIYRAWEMHRERLSDTARYIHRKKKEEGEEELEAFERAIEENRA